MIELLIVMGIIGVLAAIAIPQFTSYKQKGYDSDSKAELHHLYATCKIYWGDTSSSSNCTLALATQATYGFVQSTTMDISITAEAEGNFAAEASHTSSANTFEINSSGNISLQ